MLSGLTDTADHGDSVVNLVATHSLLIDTLSESRSLDDDLQHFWKLESLGILQDEQSIYDTFTQQITFQDQRYVVSLPWKESHPNLPTNFELCQRQLEGLLRRLRQDTNLFSSYHRVIQDQIEQGIVEPALPTNDNKAHYLPHHPVIRQDRATSKVRIVYDASARSNGPSLNDCLYKGPPFSQNIFDIILRFRCHRVALIGDIEKAFLMVGVSEQDRDVLRFLWIKDPSTEPNEVVKLRFTRVVFGVSSSPFLLNATINSHIRRFVSTDPDFVEKFSHSIYVNDLITGFPDAENAYDFYIKSKQRLLEAAFKLRKFMTNSIELYQKISENEEMGDIEETHKVLGIQWNPLDDQLIFDTSDIVSLMEKVTPTKRNVVSLATKFYDPLGLISPIIVRFKIFFQVLCESKVNWDECLTGELKEMWSSLVKDLQHLEKLSTPRCHSMSDGNQQYSLLAFWCISTSICCSDLSLHSNSD